MSENLTKEECAREKKKQMIDFSLCDENKQRIDSLRPFSNETLRSLRDYYRVGLTYSSNALEGNSLTESETKIVIEEGLTVKGKPLHDVFEAVGHAKAYDHIYKLSKRSELKESNICELHQMFYEKINASEAGHYRTVQVFISGSHHALPTPLQVPQLMKDFVQWFNENEQKYHPVEFAALVHKHFVFIHPFIDGNGRLSRLLMNLVFLRAGYTIAIIPPILRGEYISTLEQAHTNDRFFIEFIKGRVLETQNEILRLLGQEITAVENISGGINGGINGGIKSGLDEVLLFVQNNPGIKTKEITEKLGISKRTTERYLQRLTYDKRIIYKGSLKTGGYFAM